MPPNTTTWPLEPHTVGKHLVLRGYIDAWLPIMTKWNKKVLFIDAFAGPGEYANGEPGSPVIALRSLMEHSSSGQIRNEVKYFFIEKDERRCKNLERVLSDLDGELPSNCDYGVINSTFNDTLSEVLDYIDQQRARLAPAFVMIDPFGVSDTPMSVIARILENAKSEVYISFMSREINRFKEHQAFEQHLDGLFGCPEWRHCKDLADFYELYKSQLKKNGARYVLHFELYEANELIYAIFFGTKNLQGCDKMKQAIWNVAPFGDFRFRGSQLGQMTLGADFVDLSLLESALHEQFGTKDWVKIEDVESFVKSDATGFHSRHLKSKTLGPMEAAGKIEVRSDSRKVKGKFPKGTILRFR